LIEPKGLICKPEELIGAEYLSREGPKYLTKAFYQQIGNFNKIAISWLQNVRGKGYRLVDPGSKSQEVKL